jgi:hypothetical protein
MWLALCAGGAMAAPASSGSLSGGGATWTGITSGSAGFSIDDASINNQGDAFDSALRFSVGGLVYNPTGSFDLTGQTATGANLNLGGLNVFVQYYADTASPTLRTLITLSNLGTGTITTTLRLQTNVGSDGSTQTVGTSSGDTAFTTADRWIITDDNPTGGDPTNTHVLWGKGALAPTSVGTTVFSSAGDQGVLADFALAIAAGQTQSLMFFNQIQPTAALAQDTVNGFDNLSATSPLLAGLSNTQVSQIQNWNFGTQEVPEPGALALLGLGLAGLGWSRRPAKAKR